jgi:hypothetical protein
LIDRIALDKAALAALFISDHGPYGAGQSELCVPGHLDYGAQYGKLLSHGLKHEFLPPLVFHDNDVELLASQKAGLPAYKRVLHHLIHCVN